MSRPMSQYANDDGYDQEDQVKKPSNTCCGFHITVAAAASCIVQTLIATYLMASSGLMLSRYRLWEWYETNQDDKWYYLQTTWSPIYLTSLKPWTSTYYLWPNIHTTWDESFVEFSMMFMVGFCAGWLVSCLLMGCSFYHYRHYMVMGNFCMLIAALGILIIPIGGMCTALLDVTYWAENVGYADHIMAIWVAFAMAFWLLLLVLIIVEFKYMKYLKAKDVTN